MTKIKHPAEKPDPKPPRERLHEDQRIRKELDEDQVDKMVADTFPASDPPSTY